MPRRLKNFLYPHLSSDQRRREIRFLLAALLTGLATASVIALVMIMVGEHQLR
jgi:hypothetical protein